MITIDEVRKAYSASNTKPHVGPYIDSQSMQAHPLGAIALSRNIPVKAIYEYFGASFVDDFNVGFFNQHPRLAYDKESYELGAKFREQVESGELLNA